MVLAASNMVEYDFMQSKGGYSAGAQGALTLFENFLLIPPHPELT
jgi:hypothetical protein